MLLFQMNTVSGSLPFDGLFYLLCGPTAATLGNPKSPSEERIITLDGTSRLPVGAIITGIESITVSMMRGTDPNAASVIGSPQVLASALSSGGVTIAANKAVQMAALGGLDGCWYLITVTCTTNESPITVALKAVLAVSAS